jgi:zinc transport system permease protein
MLEALQFEFMRNALFAGVLVSIACGIIGSYVVVNRTVFISGGIAHAAYGGIGLGYFLGIEPIWAAIPFSLAAAVIMGFVQQRTRQYADTLIGVLWAMGMAIGIIFIDLTPGYTADLMSYLFGSILAVPRSSVLVISILDAVIILLFYLFYKEFQAISFDEEFAKVLNVPVEAFYFLQLGLTALTVVVAMRVVGLIMVIALLTIPAAISIQLTTKLHHMMILSSILGIVFTLVGLYLSYIFNLTSGATIIMVAGPGFLLSMVYERYRSHNYIVNLCIIQKMDPT